jgi:hypothetical protein
MSRSTISTFNRLRLARTFWLRVFVLVTALEIVALALLLRAVCP